MFAGSKQDLDLRCRQTLMTNAYFFNLILIKLTYKLMRRFTLFLALCLMCIGGTALAQSMPFKGSQAPDDGNWPAEGMHWYTIKNHNNHYLKVNLLSTNDQTQ